ncbi:unnamed protein product [Vitrella brassicaformis CCMP3155]|uniref:galactinol--sucrose galactosyltransferase n=1 Tax=Vitrella brassicaformis (strain CCMP3155) TaxID=1169540 RepID=A0A0G4F8Z7_VITBC|nr:unnamed protein product [Vitrella brassicaformis CCMP3155]|eukprot:CEM08804.1 unnamed protein product [Vitrella brassicaformis CCMP3155]
MSEAPMETQFCVLRVAGGGKGSDGEFAVLAPLVCHEGECRSTIEGGGAFDDFVLVVTTNNACFEPPRGANLLMCLHPPRDTSLYETLNLSASVLSRLTRGRCLPRLAKERVAFLPSPPPAPPPLDDPYALLREWGWCSWDAYGLDVMPQHVRDVLRYCCQGGGVVGPPGWVVLDDGWQEHGWQDREDFSRKAPQSGFDGNERFAPLAQSIARLREGQHDVKVLVWHTIQGYWGGVREALAKRQGYGLRTGVLPVFPPAFWEYGRDTAEFFNQQYQIVVPKDIERYYSDFYGFLQQQGVWGVKLDSQGLLEHLTEGCLAASGPKYTLTYKTAAAKAAALHFSSSAPSTQATSKHANRLQPCGRILHCMSNSSACLYASGGDALTRTSDDHAFPHVEERAEDVAIFIWTNATVSLWVGTLCRVDWDMFRLADWCGKIHALARVVSGGPIYLSDEATLFDKSRYAKGGGPLALLRKCLVPRNCGTSSSSPHTGREGGCVVPCIDVGLPSVDCVFVDPLVTPQGYKVVNVCMGGWIVVVFGLCDSEGELYPQAIYPSDVLPRPSPALWAFPKDRNNKGLPPPSLLCFDEETRHAAPLIEATPWEVSLFFMHARLYAIVPIHPLHYYPSPCHQQPPQLLGHVSIVGLDGVFNSPGTLLAPPEPVRLTVRGRQLTMTGVMCCPGGDGDLLVWSDSPTILVVRWRKEAQGGAGLSKVRLSWSMAEAAGQRDKVLREVVTLTGGARDERGNVEIFSTHIHDT